MSTTATIPSTVGPAPWKAQFLKDVSKMDSPEFVFTSLTAANSKDSPVPYLPRSRYCIFRGMWAELPDNKHNEAPMNDQVYESDLLTLTSDVRMKKIPEIFASSQGHGSVDQSQGSGGGGPVEAVFWIKTGDVKSQWRIKGEAYVVGEDIEGSGEESSGVRTVKSNVGERMRVVKEEGKDDWSWGKELTAHFGNLAPTMRGSFKNPPPGDLKSNVPKNKELRLGQTVEDLHDEVARANFRVIIIKPDEVEQIDLTDSDAAGRWRYTYVGPNSSEAKKHSRDGEDIVGWKREELWT